MIIIKSNLVPKHTCVNLFGTFWTRDKSWIDKYVVNHERIHTQQQKELLFIFFYILYILEWLFRLIQYRKQHEAYMNISFEREAYKYGHDLTYLSQRKLYSWTQFLRMK
ncbi:MAG: hypothetical protein J1E95_11305 [Muribaculaceae bacterium]|nr:hypothetical protein [Muribaculaceae bacterium]